MNRGFFLFGTIGMVLGSLFLAIFFIPSASDVAYYYLNDRQYKRAFITYTDLFSSGDHSDSIVIPFVRAQAAILGFDEPIAVMKAYVEEHPEGEATWKHLGDLYRDSGKIGILLGHLSEQGKRFPRKKTFEEMAELAYLLDDLEMEKRALEELVFQYKPNVNRFKKLTLINARENKHGEALRVIDRFIELGYWRKIDPLTAQFFLEILLVDRQETRALVLAKKLIGRRLAKNDLSSVMRPFLKRELFEETLALLQFDQLTAENIALKREILLEANRGEEVYQFLEKLWKEGKLPEKEIPSFFSASLAQENLEVPIKLLSRLSIEEIEKEELVSAAYLASAQENIKFIKMMEHWLDGQEGDPYLIALYEAASLPLAREEEENLQNTLALENFSAEEKGSIAQLLLSKGYKDVSKELLETISSSEGVKRETLFTWTDFARDLDAWEWLQTIVDADTRESVREQMSLLIQFTKEGDLPKIPEAQTEEMFLEAFTRIALREKKGFLAKWSAETLYNKKINTETTKLFAHALILNREAEWGFALLKKLKLKGKNIDQEQLIALVIASQYDFELKEKLQKELSREFELFPKNEQLLREVGYELMRYEEHQFAEPLYALLAKEKPFSHDSVQSLLTIWGETPTNQQAKWIYKQAKEAKEKWGWIAHLTYVGYPELAIDLVNQEDLSDEKVVDIYLEALVLAKQKEELRGTLALVYQNEERPERLKTLAKRAREGSLPRMSEAIYLKLLRKNPEDLFIHKRLGFLAFEQGHYQEALCYLGNCLDSEEQDAILLYTIGEIFWVKEMKWRSYSYYWCAYCNLLQQEKLTLEQKVIQANLFSRFGMYHQAISSYCSLMKEHPKDAYVRAAFVQLLIELDKEACAGNILSTFVLNEESEGETSILSAEIQLLQKRGCLCKALKKSSQAIQKYPEDPDLYVTRAGVHFAYGRWRRALSDLRCALHLSPGHEGYCLIRKEVVKEHLPYFSSTWERKNTAGGQRETLGRFRHRKCLKPGLDLTAVYERNSATVETYVKPQTGTVSSNDSKHQRGEITLSLNTCSGNLYEGSFLIGEGVLGGALSATRLDPWGHTTAIVEYHKPNWEFIQGVIDQGSRDAVRLRRVHRLRPRLIVDCEGSYREYHLNDLPRVATTAAVSLGVIYTLPSLCFSRCILGDNSEMSLGYLLDGEYDTSVLSRLDPLNNPYQPFPLTSREAHTGLLFVSKEFPCKIRFEGNGGYTYDRKSKKGGLVGTGALSIGCRPGLEGRLEYSHSIGTDDKQSDVGRTIAELRYTY